MKVTHNFSLILSLLAVLSVAQAQNTRPSSSPATSVASAPASSSTSPKAIYAQAVAYKGPYSTLQDLQKALLAEGPITSPDFQQRDVIVRSFESFILKEPFDQNPEIVRYFRTMCDHAIDQIAAEKGETPGVKIWKLYASSYVCRAGNTVFAFDLNAGLHSQRWQPTSAPNWSAPPKTDTDFVMTDEQIARLAKLVDVAFYSHQDIDHIDYQFIHEMIKAGKTVVVTPPVLKLDGYKDFANKLTAFTPEEGKVYPFDELKVEALATRQEYAPPRPSVPDNVYLVTTPTGVVCMHKGDANVGEEAWKYFEAYKKRGGKVDIYMGGYSGFARGKDTFHAEQKIHDAFNDFIIPGHSYEWGHLRLGNGKVMTYYDILATEAERLKAGRGCVLTWGECYWYKP